MSSEPFDIQTDSDLESAVRTETGYDTGKLPSDDLSSLIDSAKRVLALKANVTDFYNERGLAVALLGITCAKAKGRVENSPVRVKNLAGQDVTFRTSDGDSIQVSAYEMMVETGLTESTETDAGARKMRVTRDFLTDSSTR